MGKRTSKPKGPVGMHWAPLERPPRPTPPGPLEARDDPAEREYIHQCLVRAVLRMRVELGSAVAREWLRKYEANGDRMLRIDVLEQWSLGSRGEHGVWLERSGGQ